MVSYRCGVSDPFSVGESSVLLSGWTNGAKVVSFVIFLCLSVPPTRCDALMMIVQKGAWFLQISIAQTEACSYTHRAKDDLESLITLVT